MSGVGAAAGMGGVSWLSNQTKNTFHPSKSNQTPSKSSLYLLESHRRQHNFRAHCTSNNHQFISEALSNSDTFHANFKIQHLILMDLDPATAKLAIGLLGPFLSAFGFLFILRIVMSWYPKLPVEKFPYVVAYAPTEPILSQTRKVIPPLGGVDVTPVVWFGLISFLSEILVGPQGLLVLLSQQRI